MLGGAALVAVLAGAVGAAGVSSARSEAPARRAAVDDEVRINQIQTIGSHNSYHRLPSVAEQDLRRSFIGEGADLMTYHHQPLGYQFESQKVRQIELDVFLDAEGGKYADPLLRAAAGLGGLGPEMSKPGIKVLHVQDVDYDSNCTTLVACLRQIEAWSDANPSHAPIAILLELKDEELDFGGLEFVIPEAWTAAGMASLDAEIRSVMDPADMITPDDVRGSRATLNEAVTTDGWPTLGESRGKVMFMMDNCCGAREAYLQGAPTLEGRAIFTNSEPGEPDAAFVKRNDPFDASIPDLVKAGYVVRTRSDGDTEEARDNDTGPRDAALASGAQWVSTDYPRPGLAVGFTTDYFAEIPGGTVARCNPVNAPAGCVDADLDTVYTPNDVLPDPPPGTDVPAGPDTTAPEPTVTREPLPLPGTIAPGAPAPAQPVAGRPDYTG